MAELPDDFGRVGNFDSADFDSLADALKSAVGKAVENAAGKAKSADDSMKKEFDRLVDSLEELGEDIRASLKQTKKFVESVKKAAKSLNAKRAARAGGVGADFAAAQKEQTRILQMILKSQQKALASKAAKFTSGSSSLSAAQPPSRKIKPAGLSEIGFKPRGKDRRAAMLSDGEYVVNEKATRRNLGVLQAINSGKIKGFSKGGMVKPKYMYKGSQTGGVSDWLGGGGAGAKAARIRVMLQNVDLDPQARSRLEKMFAELGHDVEVDFSDEFNRGLRGSMARWSTGIAAAFVGDDPFARMFEGGVKDITEFRVEMRKLAFLTEGITGEFRDAQAEFSRIGENISSRTGKNVTAFHKAYLANSRKGYKDQKVAMKSMESGLKLSTLIGSETQATAALFADWHRELNLGAAQMDRMANSMQMVARRTGVTGDELTGVMKSSEGILKNLRKQGTLTTTAAGNIIESMAEFKKSGFEDLGQRMLGAMSGYDAFEGADEKTKSFLGVAANRGIGEGGYQDLMFGKIPDDAEKMGKLGEGIKKMMADTLDIKVEDFDLDKLTKTQMEQLTVGMQRTYGVGIGEAEDMMKNFEKKAKGVGGTLADLDKARTSKSATAEQRAESEKKMNDTLLSASMDQLKSVQQATEKMGDKNLSEIGKELGKDTRMGRDFATGTKDLMGISSYLSDATKRQFGLSGDKDQMAQQIKAMDQGKQMQLRSMAAAEQLDKTMRENGAGSKNFSGKMKKALAAGDTKTFNALAEEMTAAYSEAQVKDAANVDPMVKLEQTTNELNETMRKFLSPLLGGIIDFIGAAGLMAVQLGFMGAALYATMGGNFVQALSGFKGLGTKFDDYAQSMASQDGMFKKFFQTYKNARTPSTPSRMMDIAEYRKFRKQGLSAMDAKKSVEKMGGFSKGKGVLGSLNDAFGGLRDDMLNGMSRMRGATVDFFQNAGKASGRFFRKFLSGFRHNIKTSGNFFTSMTKGFSRAMKSSGATSGILAKVGGAMKGLNGRYLQTLNSLRKTSPALANFLHKSVMLGKSFTTLNMSKIIPQFASTMKSGFSVFKNVFKPSSWKALFSMGSKGLRGAILGGSLGTAQIIFSAIDMVFGAVSGFMNTGKNFEGVLKAMGKSTKEATWGMYASSTAAGALVGILDGLTFGLLGMTGATKWLNETLSLLFYVVFSYVEGWVEGIMEAFKMVGSAFSYIGEQFKSMGDSLLGVFNSIAGLFGSEAGNWSEAMAMIYPWLKAIGKVIGFVVGMPLIAYLWLVVKGISAALVPIQMLINAVAGVIKIFASVFQFFRDIFTVGLSQAFWNLGANILNAVIGVFRPIVDFVWSIANDIMAPFKWLYNILVGNSIIPDLCVGIVGFFGKMALNVIKTVAALPLKAVKFMASLPMKMFRGLNNVFFKAPVKIFGKIFKHLSGKTVKEGLVAVGGKMSNFFSLFGKNLKDLTGFFGNSWFNFLNTASGGIFGKVVNAVRNSKIAALVDDFLIKPIAQGLSWLGNKAGEVFSWAGKRAKEVFGPAFNWIKGQVNKIMPGAKAGADIVSKVAQKGAAKIAEKTGVKAALDASKASRFQEFKRLRATGLSAADAKAQMGSKTTGIAKDLASKANNSIKGLAQKGLAKATEMAPKTTGMLKTGASKATDLAKSVGSKFATKGSKAVSTVAGSVDDLAKAAPTALSFLGKSSGLIKGMARKLPVVGPMLDFGIRTMSGQSLAKAGAGTAAGAAGGLGGAAMGAAIGTMIFPGVGTAIGGLLGGVLGGVGAGMASDAVYDKVVGTGSKSPVDKAATAAAEKIGTASAATATPVGEHAIPTARPARDATNNVEPVHLRDITGSILRDKAGVGGNRLQSDELTRMEEASHQQVSELEQIRQGINELVSLMRPGGESVGESEYGGGGTRDSVRPAQVALYGRMKNGKMGGLANRGYMTQGG